MAENEQNASENVVEMELHESMEKLWNATLNRIPQLQDTFRSRMINTLGKDGAKRIMNDVEVKRNLATLLAQSGSGIVQLVPGLNKNPLHFYGSLLPLWHLLKYTRFWLKICLF